MSFTTTPVDAEREELFTVDGVAYTIAKTVPASAGLEYIRIAAEVNTDAGIVFAMRTALGTAGFNALRAAQDVTAEDMRAVMNACTTLLLGSVMGPKATP
jgi:hypothetical protein